MVVGRLFPRDDPTVAQKAFEQLAQVLPGSVALPSPLPAPSALYRTLFDRLIVYDDIQPGKGGVYGWEPIQIDRGKPGNTLGDWFSLPWGGPETVILPGFHTPAENAMKQVGAATAGQEMFLSVCGLMSTRRADGAVEPLANRRPDQLRPGPRVRPGVAPCLAVGSLAAGDPPLRRVAAEPRRRAAAEAMPDDEAPKASHPLFWAGYMLIDSGEAGEEVGGPLSAIRRELSVGKRPHAECGGVPSHCLRRVTSTRAPRFKAELS